MELWGYVSVSPTTCLSNLESAVDPMKLGAPKYLIDLALTKAAYGYADWKKTVVRGKHVPPSLDDVSAERNRLVPMLAALDAESDRLQSDFSNWQNDCAFEIGRAIDSQMPVLDKTSRFIKNYLRSWNLCAKDSFSLNDEVQRRYPDEWHKRQESLTTVWSRRAPIFARLVDLCLEEICIRYFLAEQKDEAERLSVARKLQAEKERIASQVAMARSKSTAAENARLELVQRYEQKYDRHRFKIRDVDYKRGNRLDNLFRGSFLPEMLAAFDGVCVRCGSADGLALDHFGIPKNEGGNFILVDSETKQLVVNVAILCVRCNSKKGEKRPYEVLTIEQLSRIDVFHSRLASGVLRDKKVVRTLTSWYKLSPVQLWLSWAAEQPLTGEGE